MTDQYKRQTAYPCTCKHVREGQYVKQDGWEPNFVLSSIGVLSRVRLAGVLVKQSSPLSFVLDDGSGLIALRFFSDDFMPSLNIGQAVMVIGRPREVGDERFVVVEIAKVLSDMTFLKTFHDTLAEFEPFIPNNPPKPLLDTPQEQVTKVQEPPQVFEPSKTNKAQVLLDAIRELDKGDGAPTDEVLKIASFPDAPDKLKFLITEGEVFELRAGKIKVLE